MVEGLWVFGGVGKVYGLYTIILRVIFNIVKTIFLSGYLMD